MNMSSARFPWEYNSDSIFGSEATVVVGDWHLPAPWVNRAAIQYLLCGDIKKLILNGDILDWRYARKLTPEDRDILRKLENLQQKGRIIAIRGNHERLILGLKRITSLRFVDHYDWGDHGQRFFVCHGHQFCSLFGDKRDLENNAVVFAKKRAFRAVIVGHNHVAALREHGDVTYANAGVNSCVAVSSEGSVKLVPINQLGRLRRRERAG